MEHASFALVTLILKQTRFNFFNGLKHYGRLGEAAVKREDVPIANQVLFIKGGG